MIKKLLVSGCSFTDGYEWPNLLFPTQEFQIVNLAKSAAGNSYIASSIMYNLDCRPDFVNILWSGINRIDMRVPNTQIMAKIE